MRGRQMVAGSSHAASTKFAFAVLIALSCFLVAQTSSGVYAKSKRPNYGRLEITTLPTAYPILIDGKPEGQTSTTGRIVELPPGLHTVEIVLPSGARWTRQFNIVAGRRNCIALNYRSKPITIVKSPCPYPVAVSAPVTVNDGDVITFTSDVTYGGTSALNYTWTVSPAAAKIISGAGTPTITVDSTGLGKQRVTAILVVDDGSGDRACRQTARAATDVVAPPPPPVQPRKFDEFPSISFDDDKARLDNLAIELQNAPTAQGYIIVYGGRTSRPGLADRLGARAKNYLVNTRGINPNRLTVVNGGYRESDYIEIWLVPQGAQPPRPTPTVQPGDVRPGPDIRLRRSRRRG